MEIVRVDALVTAFIRPLEGVNAGMIHTPAGIVLIDTTSSPGEARSLLEAVGVSVEDVRLVINTHSHSDHTWGNQVFTCPILAHRLCRERMQACLQKEWSPGELRAYLSDLEKTNPVKAKESRQVLQNLCITLPTQVFDQRFEGELGGVKYQVIHLGGHTPDLSVVWLPGNRVLFSSDLIFQGRYPYIFDADIPTWIALLDRLLEFDAEVIIPGHGVRCGEGEILALKDYLQSTWDLTAEHIRLGHNPEETAADPAFPRFPGEKYERLHQANIHYMYKKIKADYSELGNSNLRD
jgi:glyoxylase-like metal-dependent hydrolase (beta-lactamase superfamily II)